MEGDVVYFSDAVLEGDGERSVEGIFVSQVIDISLSYIVRDKIYGRLKGAEHVWIYIYPLLEANAERSI